MYKVQVYMSYSQKTFEFYWNVQLCLVFKDMSIYQICDIIMSISIYMRWCILSLNLANW